MIPLPTLALTIVMAQGPSATLSAQRPAVSQTVRATSPGLASAKLLYAAGSYEEALTHLLGLLQQGWGAKEKGL